MNLRRKRSLTLRALLGMTCSLALAAFVAPLVAPTWDLVAPASGAPVTVLNETWASCSNSQTPVAGTMPYPATSAQNSATPPVNTIGIDVWQTDTSKLTCPGWTMSGQAWWSKVTSNSNAGAPAVNSYAMYLNEGPAPGSMVTTLGSLTPGGFYEISVLAWKDAGTLATSLSVQVVSGTVTTPYTMAFLAGSNGLPQTVTLEFPVTTTSATITLTGSPTTTSSPIVGSVTVTSQPTAIFNANGGTGTMASQTAAVATPLTSNSFTRTSYTFAGWNTVADGSGTAYANAASYDFSAGNDVNLYAQWTGLPRTVTFDANGGSGSMATQMAATATALTANAFTRSGYAFAGWNTVAVGSGTAYVNGAFYPFAADGTLYAQWTATPPAPPAPAPAPAPVVEESAAPVAQAPASVPTRPPLDPIANSQDQDVPSSGLPAGSSLLLVNGVPTAVNVAANAPSAPTGLVVTGDEFTMRLAGLNGQGGPLGLSYDGGALVLEQDRVAKVEGTGFLSNSEVRLYVFSTPRYIGSVTTDESGNFSGSVPIPKDLAVGRHTLQVNGYAKDIAVRSLSLGVVVKPDREPRIRVAKATVTFMPLSAQLTPQTTDQLRALLKGRKGTAVGSLAVGYVQPTKVTGNDEALSTARARAVKAYLRTLGLKGPVTTRGDGIAKETGAAGRKVIVSIRYTK